MHDIITHFSHTLFIVYAQHYNDLYKSQTNTCQFSDIMDSCAVIDAQTPTTPTHTYRNTYAHAHFKASKRCRRRCRQIERVQLHGHAQSHQQLAPIRLIAMQCQYDDVQIGYVCVYRECGGWFTLHLIGKRQRQRQCDTMHACFDDAMRTTASVKLANREFSGPETDKASSIITYNFCEYMFCILTMLFDIPDSLAMQ